MKRITKYPSVKKRIELAKIYVDAHPYYSLLKCGLIKYKRPGDKWRTPNRELKEFGKTLVDCGFVKQKGKGSPWLFVEKIYIHGWRSFPYLPENKINNHGD